MRRLLYFLTLIPWIFWGDFPHWEAKSEEEALFLRRIADFWQEGEYPIAKSQMEEFLSTYPESNSASVLCAALGDLFLREKNYSIAANYYSKVIDPELTSHVFLNHMQCLYHMQWYATLADACEAFLQKENLSEEQKFQTTYYLAIALYQQCLNLTKEPQSLMHLAKRAEPYFEILLKSPMNKEISQAFAQLSCILKDYAKAASIYLDLATGDPENAEEMLFQAALIQAEYDKALAAATFDKIAKQGALKAKEATFNHLVLSFDQAQYQQVVDTGAEIFSKIPSEKIPTVHLIMGQSLLGLQKYPESCQELKAFLATNPEGDSLQNAVLSLIDAASGAEDLSCLDMGLAKLIAISPNDPAICRAKFARAMLFKKRGSLDEARAELQELLAISPPPAQGCHALFELMHLDFQGKNWLACREKARAWMTQYPEHELLPFAWRYLTASSSALIGEHAENRELKEELVSDLKILLKQPKLSAQDHLDMQLLFAKTTYELTRFEEAIEILQTIETLPGNGELLLGLCYRDGSKDLARFCSFAEKALAKSFDLMEKTSLHAHLFNAYLTQGQIDPAAEHLFATFAGKMVLSKENLLWLADYYGDQLQKLEEAGASTSALLSQRTASLLEKAIFPLAPIEQENLFLEKAYCRLSQLYLKMGEREKSLQIIESLAKEYRSHPEFDWKLENDLLLLRGENYAISGKDKEATQIFDSLCQEKSSLRTFVGASAALQSARIKKDWLAQSPSELIFREAAAQFKDLALQKNFANEPLHLEAALDYIDLQTTDGPDRVKKRLSLLLKMKGDFETTEDLLSKDYHQARTQMPRKNQIYQSYMNLLQAEISALDSSFNTDTEKQKQLQAKVKDILLKIVEEKAHPTLVARATKLLENGSF